MQRVLIIDDDMLQIMTARALLESIGFDTICEASNGSEAEDMIKASPPMDLVLLDLNMPDYDGIEFLDFLRANKCCTPIIIVTGAADCVSRSAAIIAEARGMRILGVLNKPITKKKLVSLWPGRECHEAVAL